MLLRLHWISAKSTCLWQPNKMINHWVRGLSLAAVHQTNQKHKAAAAISQGKRGYTPKNFFCFLTHIENVHPFQK